MSDTKMKVYISSSLTREELKARYDFKDEFEVVPTYDQADLIVFDLCHVEKDWGKYVILNRDPVQLTPRNRPVLIAGLEPDPIDQKRYDYLKDYTGCELAFYKNIQELVNTLRWFKAIFPFKVVDENMRKKTNELTLYAMKQEES